jgi:hypothetical protein
MHIALFYDLCPQGTKTYLKYLDLGSSLLLCPAVIKDWYTPFDVV